MSNASNIQLSDLVDRDDAARKMKEALEEIANLETGDFKEPLDADSSEVYEDARWEGEKFLGKTIQPVLCLDWFRQLQLAKEIAQEALAEEGPKAEAKDEPAPVEDANASDSLRDVLKKAKDNFDAIGRDAMAGHVGMTELAVCCARMSARIEEVLNATER